MRDNRKPIYVNFADFTFQHGNSWSESATDGELILYYISAWGSTEEDEYTYKFVMNEKCAIGLYEYLKSGLGIQEPTIMSKEDAQEWFEDTDTSIEDLIEKGLLKTYGSNGVSIDEVHSLSVKLDEAKKLVEKIENNTDVCASCNKPLDFEAESENTICYECYQKEQEEFNND